MRQLTTHLSAGGFNAPQVTAMDNPSRGFANSRYDITGFNTVYNPSAATPGGMPAHFTRLALIFHSGPRSIDAPLNGVTPEAVLAAVHDHLQGLQDSPEACMENQMAKDYVEAALNMLLQRQPDQIFAMGAVHGLLNRAAVTHL